MWAKQKQFGFTIVELLIVIVVIAILAAITIVAYNGIQNRAQVTTIKADFNTLSKKAELFKADSSTSVYPNSVADLTSVGVQFSKGSYNALIWCRNNAGTAWAVAADVKDGKSYYLNSLTNAVTEFAGPVQGISGGTTCPNVGVGGVWTWIVQNAGGTWAI